MNTVIEIERELSLSMEEIISRIEDILYRSDSETDMDYRIGIAQEIVKECFNMNRSISDDYSHVCATIEDIIMRKEGIITKKRGIITKKIDENHTKYNSLMDFAVLGKNDEEICLRTLIANKRSDQVQQQKEPAKQKENTMANENLRELKPLLVMDGVEKKADKLTCKYLTNKFGDPHKHWCYYNIYKAILFTLKELGV